MTTNGSDGPETGPSTGGDGEGSTRTDRRTFVRTGLVGLGAVATGAGGADFASAVAKDDYNLAHALQQSIHFYDAQKCGDDVTGQPLEWRGDCHLVDTSVPLAEPIDAGGSNVPASYVEAHADVLDPDGDGTVDLSGGFHDAGDHVKFGLPQSYTASTLGWALYEFEDAFRETGNYDHFVRILRRFTDYFLESTFRDDEGNVVAFSYQVGDGDFDHKYWGPPELQDNEAMPRPAYVATPETPASDQCGAAAAGLALQSLNLRDEDPDYAERCLDVARALYQFGLDNRGLGHGGTYYSSSGDADDLAWAAVWLHVATGEDDYLTDVVGTDGAGNYTGHVGEIIGSTADSWNNTWVHSWDTVWSGVILKLAGITDEQRWWDLAKWHLEYWTGGAVSHDDGSGNYIQTTPAGFSYLDQWGSARYNAAAQFLAAVYREQGGEKGEAFTEWARGQMQYILGDNPFGYSLVVGFTDEHAQEPHHDAAHGSTTGKLDEPPKPKHTLWGALVGGPSSDDTHNDETSDYVHNEVACDYNAGLVGALAGLYTNYGQGDESLEGFPPDEEPIEPYFVEASVENSSGSTIEVKAFLNNVAVHPPRFEDGLSFRYYFDASELEGTAPEDLTVDVFYDQVKAQLGQGTEVVGPESTDVGESIYYVEFDYSGTAIAGSYELTFAISDYTGSALEASNDWSFQDLTDTRARTEYVPVYVDGELAFGSEPGGGGEDREPPSKPGPVSVTGSSETSLDVTWGETADEWTDLHQFVVTVGESTRTTVPPTTRSTTIEGLTEGTTHVIAVQAVDTAGNSSEPATATASTASAQGPEPLDGTQPTDPDGDDVYEDLNGNGELDFDDVVTYFEEMEGEYLSRNVEYFDFNENEEIDYSDLVDLFGEIP